MGILNYSTKINALQTVSELAGILAKSGARSVSIDYDEAASPSALVFLIKVGDAWINFRLPVNVEGVHMAMMRDKSIPSTFKNRTQAARVAWRIIKDWVEAQLAIIEAGQADLAEVFMPYVVLPDGNTLYKAFASGSFPALTGGQNG